LAPVEIQNNEMDFKNPQTQNMSNSTSEFQGSPFQNLSNTQFSSKEKTKQHFHLQPVKLVNLSSKKKSEWKYKMQDFESGSYGKVGIFKRGGLEFVAGKIIEKNKFTFREFENLTMCDHPNIVKLKIFEFWEKEDVYFLGMELCNTNLNSTLNFQKEFVEFYCKVGEVKMRTRKIVGESLSLEEVPLIMEDILQGVSYLQKKFIMHRDIKPANICLIMDEEKKRYVAKLCDFGLSKVVADSSFSKHTTDQGTPWFQAPEVSGKSIYNLQCDVYSVGVTFLEIIILSKQRSGFIKKYNSYLNVFNNIIPVDYPEKMIHFEEIIIKELVHFYPLVLKMIQSDPTKRPSIDECLQQIKRIRKDESDKMIEE
jgi:serine/threonine protein kinase